MVLLDCEGPRRRSSSSRCSRPRGPRTLTLTLTLTLALALALTLTLALALALTLTPRQARGLGPLQRARYGWALKRAGG